MRRSACDGAGSFGFTRKAAVDDLADGLVGIFVQLELEDEDRLRRADVGVDAAFIGS